ncbi:ester cyclase [Williamsia sp. MIQD14]|uniref:ester cyclase n=1 Tax=Williamsia sp. MIQD14 TaxID=3425703 RepID=UPI003DA031ED
MNAPHRTFRRRSATGMLTLALIALLTVTTAACTDSNEDRASAAPESAVDRTPGLVVPEAVHLASAPTERDRRVVAVAQKLYTFWNSGDTTFLRAAVAPAFRDNTLPAGRPQGPAGPVAASAMFRKAIPDLTCRLADLYVTGDTFTARLVFAGHFTGVYDGVRGAGQPIEFGAIDIQHTGSASTIVEDWHLEDNLTFLQQAGLVRVGDDEN